MTGMRPTRDPATIAVAKYSKYTAPVTLARKGVIVSPPEGFTKVGKCLLRVKIDDESYASSRQ